MNYKEPKQMFRLFAPKSAEDNEKGVWDQAGFRIGSETLVPSRFPSLIEVQGLQLIKRDHSLY